MGRRVGDREPAAEGGDAIVHVLQSGALVRGRHGEAGAVVGHGELQFAGVRGLLERDGDLDVGPAVLGRVLNGLEAAVVDR